MCNKNTPSDMKTRSTIKKEIKAREPLKPARKSRSKTRKPKFLSLRLELSSENSQNSNQMTHSPKTNHHEQYQKQHQLNLFPLHPENLVEDKDMIHDENVAFLFSSEGGGGATTTLNGLLAGVSSSEEDSLSVPPYAYGGQDSEEGGRLADGGNNCHSASSKLVRTAMRNRDRDPSDEKWVCYSEVLVEKKEPEEVTSCVTDVWCAKARRTTSQGLLSLKLDYQGILNAWSGKGPLYIEGESPPQTVPDLHVPDLHDDFLPHDTANVLVDSWGSAANVWRVPEMGNDYIGSIKVEEEVEDKDGWKMRHREASVLRYKEKRQNRLFSKRIRYEVRKLNAEKRPRMKGRFVKRS